MRTCLWLFLLSGFFFGGCGHGNQIPEDNTPPADTSRYYSLEGFYHDQIEYVDLRNFNISRVSTIDGKKDSAGMSKSEWVAMASRLFPKQALNSKEKAKYRENVFEDQSTNSYTLNYTAQDPSLEIRSLDILLDKQLKTVKRVFVKSLYKTGDTTVEQLFSLKANKSMQLNRSFTVKGKTSTELNYIKWNE